MSNPQLPQLNTSTGDRNFSKPTPSWDAATRSPLRSSQSPDDDAARFHNTPYSPVRIQSPQILVQEASSAVIESASPRIPRKAVGASSPTSPQQALPYRGTHVRNISAPLLESMDPVESVTARPSGSTTDDFYGQAAAAGPPESAPLQYHHEKVEEDRKAKRAQRVSHGTIKSSSSDSPTLSSVGENSQSSNAQQQGPRASLSKTRFAPGLDAHSRGRSLTPHGLRDESPRPLSGYGRNLSTGSASRLSEMRPASTVDLLNNSYSQQMAQQIQSQDHARLEGSVGQSAALLDTQKTLDMYRANVKKTSDSTVQYEFALFMVNAAQQMPDEPSRNPSPNPSGDTRQPNRRKELLKEAKTILQRLSDKGFPYAQYYLADGYASGLFSNGKPDQTSAFGLFIAAGKHGHAEAGYRAALCYEFGWGCRRDVAKAVQYHRQAASKGHPGAAVRLGRACLTGDMGQQGKHREGITWLKRATEHADRQYNSGPYELGILHIEGYGADVFKDEAYAAQLLTQAAELGHPEAAMRMGECYEHGMLTCPRDPALSIHYYTTAADAGFPEAMMSLCAWYMVGAEPVLQEDRSEAYMWAKRSAELELPKGEYTVGFFTEMGIGCRRDPLEANVWYVRASDHGDERATSRLRVIREAETGNSELANREDGTTAAAAASSSSRGLKKKKDAAAGTEGKDEKDCIVM